MSELRPLSPLETRCHAALVAFQGQHGRLPTLKELTAAAGFDKKGQAGEALHRLVCKGWIESDRLAPEPRPPAKPRRLKAKPHREPKPPFRSAGAASKLSAVLLRELDPKLAAGLSWRELRRTTGVQMAQVQRLRETGDSLRLSVADRLCSYLALSLSTAERDDETPSETLRRAVNRQLETGASLEAICRAAEVSSTAVARFVAERKTISLRTADRLCEALGVELLRRA